MTGLPVTLRAFAIYPMYRFVVSEVGQNLSLDFYLRPPQLFIYPMLNAHTKNAARKTIVMETSRMLVVGVDFRKESAIAVVAILVGNLNHASLDKIAACMFR